MPMVLLPPPRFSTITGCLSRSLNCCATWRATISAPPPAAYGTITLMGLVGKSPCARAQGAAQSPSAAEAAARSLRARFLFIVVLVRVDGSVRSVHVAMTIVVVHQFLRHVGEELA